MEKLEPGDLVMCTVEKITGTTVFVKIDENGQGSITLSEVAPGRIRNLREYVVPKKRIVCKVLRTGKEIIELSLRRVTLKEQKEVKEREKIEKSYFNILKITLKEKSKEIINKITQKQSLYEFIEKAKKEPAILEKLIGKEQAKKVLEILKAQKTRKIGLKKEFFLSSYKPDGIKIIKDILSKIKDAKVTYLSAGRFLIKAEAENAKQADKKIKENLKIVEDLAKKKGAEFKLEK